MEDLTAFTPILESLLTCEGVSGCGVAHMRGMRATMEDSYTALPVPNTPFLFLSVFDGHGGRGVADFASTHLLPCIMESEAYKSAAVSGFATEDDSLLFSSLRAGFNKCDADAYVASCTSGDRSGSTAIAALISPHRIIVANSGDSRAVLVRTSVEGGTTTSTATTAAATITTTALSSDHKPDSHKERARLMPLAGAAGLRGGYFSGLAVSRTLGDFRTKLDHARSMPGAGPPPLLPTPQQTVTSDPEVMAAVRHPSDAFLVMACDGVWDVVTNDEAASIVWGAVLGGAGPKEAAAALIHECLERGSSDNMTAIVADLRVVVVVA